MNCYRNLRGGAWDKSRGGREYSHETEHQQIWRAIHVRKGALRAHNDPFCELQFRFRNSVHGTLNPIAARILNAATRVFLFLLGVFRWLLLGRVAMLPESSGNATGSLFNRTHCRRTAHIDSRQDRSVACCLKGDDIETLPTQAVRSKRLRIRRPPLDPVKVIPSVPSQGFRNQFLVAASIVIAVAVVALWISVFLPRAATGHLPSVLLALVLVALSAAIALHVRFLLLARRSHQETARVLGATEREFESIFDSALDAILILDDRGICLEANPAALTLFRSERHKFVGHPIEKFGFGAGGPLLGPNAGHGETEISCDEREPVFVEYTVTANYLPGRHVAILRDISARRRAEAALRASDERFREMANNIQEVYWMIDAESKRVLSVNPAYETITGRSLQTLQENPTSYQELFHPEDRVRLLTRLEEAEVTGQIDEEFRIIRPDHAVRWVAVHGFPVRDRSGIVRRLVGTAQDITARKSAEQQMARNLALAESASAEADALRKTTLALTQNLSMDSVLDTLLASLLKLIPCESARVLLVETDTHLFLAREMRQPESGRRLPKCPPTVDASDNRFLMQALATRVPVLVPDTALEPDWQTFKGYAHMGSWLAVPLVASQRVLGLLSLGDARAHAFTLEHVRLAKSLAIPAAVAIQNARLYERAEIYGTELEQRLEDLEKAQNALSEAEQHRELSEERFAKVFRSSPIAFSITTLAEGRFIDVNQAFERRYGYLREEVVGRTVFDIGIWDDPGDRARMQRELREAGRVQNRTTRFRKRSGEIIETRYSADVITLDGLECLLAVSEDLPEGESLAARERASDFRARAF
jgi:PAS domain S-box-containing protein